MKFFALASAAAAASHTIRTDFMSYAKAPNLMQSLIGAVVREAPKADPGMVTFSQCDDDLGLFTFDEDSTTVTPQPITKGSTIDFDLVGGVSDTVTVENFHVHVDWNTSPLYDEDDEDGTTYDSDYEFHLSWDVPTYAPDGDYSIDLIGYTGDSKKAVCVHADFTF